MKVLEYNVHCCCYQAWLLCRYFISSIQTWIIGEHKITRREREWLVTRVYMCIQLKYMIQFLRDLWNLPPYSFHSTRFSWWSRKSWNVFQKAGIAPKCYLIISFSTLVVSALSRYVVWLKKYENSLLLFSSWFQFALDFFINIKLSPRPAIYFTWEIFIFILIST